MPRFGQPAGRRAAQRSTELFISVFKDPDTLTRFLWENPFITWFEYGEHYHHGAGPRGKGLSYPCVARSKEFAHCIGCTMPVTNEYEEDLEERDKDPGWRLRRVSYKYIVPTLAFKEGKEYLTLRKVSGEFRTKMVTAYDARGEICSVDWNINRTGTGFETNFKPTPIGEPSNRKYTAELRAAYAANAEGMAAAFGTPEYDQAWDAWNQANRALGVPDGAEGGGLDTLLGQKYAEAVEWYGLTDAQLAERAQSIINAGGTAQPVAQVAPPVVQAPAAAVATVDTGSMAQVEALGVLAAELQSAGIPYPADATLQDLQQLRTMFASRFAQAAPAAAVAAAPPAQPIAAPPATPEVTAPAAGGPNFREWQNDDIRSWLSEHNIPWDQNEPRSKLLTKAEAGF